MIVLVSLKHIGRIVAATLGVGFSVCFGGCSAEDSPLSDCVPKETHCDGKVAVECVKYGGGKSGPIEFYSFVKTTCEAPLSCFAGDSFATCSLSAEPCDLSTFKGTCAGDRVVICDYASEVSSAFFQTVAPPCKFGNTCLAGGCGAPSDTTCDPMTYAPTCTNGVPTICAQMGNGISDQYRAAFETDACADGNQCLTGPGWVGCGRDGTTCKSNAFQRRCEGDKWITCELAYDQMLDIPVELEYQTTCPKGCSSASGVAACNP